MTGLLPLCLFFRLILRENIGNNNIAYESHEQSVIKSCTLFLAISDKKDATLQ